MKITIKHNELYWTGCFKTTRDGNEVILIVHRDISMAKIFQDEESATKELRYWQNVKTCYADDFVVSMELEKSDFNPDEVKKAFDKIDFSNVKPQSGKMDNVYFGSMDGGEFIVPRDFCTSQYPNPTFEKGGYSRPDGTLRYELPKPRTISEILKEADENRDDSRKLLLLSDELWSKSNSYQRHEVEFADEHIKNYIEEIKNCLRKEKVKRYFEED